jgi:hypothetical protein
MTQLVAVTPPGRNEPIAAKWPLRMPFAPSAAFFSFAYVAGMSSMATVHFANRPAVFACLGKHS